MVKDNIARAFDEGRCYDFYIDRYIIQQLKVGDPIEQYRELMIGIKNRILDSIAGGDQNRRTRLFSDTRLASRIVGAIAIMHRAVAGGPLTSIIDRRIVVVKELPNELTLYHISRETTVIASVGSGPPWAEIPSIYLGLKIFDALIAEQRKGTTELFEAFKHLLLVEERACETGYTHSTVFPPEVSISLNYLVDEVIKNASQFELEEEKKEVEVKRERPFTDANRKTFIRDLDARVPGDELNFDYDTTMKAIMGLERLARRYKRGDDRESMHEVIRILVAASGHDIHEIRNRANLLLERLFAPKEFDAPLATRFINVSIGENYEFAFQLPEEKGEYYLRIYANSCKDEIFLEKDIVFEDVPLEYDERTGHYAAVYTFNDYGHYDFIVIKKKIKNFDWIVQSGSSGRVNVLPDLTGELIIEVFVDIHGHTRAYWYDGSGHPGLLYNENGQVIRLGRFSDITVHLEQIKSRYNLTALYLLGVQKRGSNHEDWAPEASSPSPFSPMSLIEIEPSLGGELEFKELVEKAHTLGIKIIVDIIPHINRRSDHLKDDLVVLTYGHDGQLVQRASTDGRYGSWNDGKLLNYRKFEIWEWLASSVETLIEKFDIDGIRFDSAHAVPIMMKKNNYLYVYDRKRSHEEMVEGNIIVNDREDSHFITTSYYDSACRDIISVPLHYFLMLRIQRKLAEKKKTYFIHIAECYWGHERFLTRTGLIPYNSAMFKICENIIHGKTDVREIYHVYDNYFPSSLPEGTELLGILGNHDERRALNTFGHRGLRAAVGLSCFMSRIIMDYEGSAEGEGWKVFLDNIYVNWNQFEYAAHRSLELFYQEWYKFHRESKGKGYLVWANNHIAAAAIKFVGESMSIGVFNFSDSNQGVSIQFDNPVLPIPDDGYYKLSDPLYSGVTNIYNYFKGSELKISRINTIVPYTDRVKMLRLDLIDATEFQQEILKDSFHRLCSLAAMDKIFSNFAFSEIMKHASNYSDILDYIKKKFVPMFWEGEKTTLVLGLKRAAFYLYKNRIVEGKTIVKYARALAADSDAVLRELGEILIEHNQRGPLVFMSAEAEPFSKSGGLANVVYELPRELVRLGEEVHVITGFYKNGDEKAMKHMHDSVKKYNVTYTGKNVRFMIMNHSYEVGVHYALVDGVHYYLLDHYEFFDGLYWGYTGAEKMRRRIAFARACAELIMTFNITPRYTFTNDAYAGLFNGIVRADSYYMNSNVFRKNTFLHIVHNGGWQYFDSYHRWENEFDLYNFFNLPPWRAGDFADPHHGDKINCMAVGIRFADRTITVSPSYARQIEYACDGLEAILHNVIGISNAIGMDFREKLNERFKNSGFVERNLPLLMEHIRKNKELFRKIEKRYPELLEAPDLVDTIADEKRRYIVTRMRNKLMLQLERRLAVDPDIILFTFIHRISEQKGYQLLLESSEGIMKNLNFQGIIGGAISWGDKKGDELAHGLYLLSQYYPGQLDVNFGFQEVAVPLLSSDVFLMPSMHEPGGISQLEAFAAGCLVVARATGGLRDTVFPVRPKGDEVEGNGFLFTDYTPWSFYDAMERVSAFFRNNSEDILYKARKNAENSVSFWEKPAKDYIEKIYTLTETIRIL